MYTRFGNAPVFPTQTCEEFSRKRGAELGQDCPHYRPGFYIHGVQCICQCFQNDTPIVTIAVTFWLVETIQDFTMYRTSQQRLPVVFVGSFRSAGDKIAGGQMYACTSLIEAEFSFPVDWIKIDSTASTNRDRPFSERLGGAIRRLFKFSKCISHRDRQIVLIFLVHGFGFVEKGLMVLLARVLRKSVVLAPRSGLIIDDVRRSKLMHWFVRRVVRASTRIICQSTQWSEFYGDLLGEHTDKIVVIHNWIASTKYSALPRTELHTAGEPVTIVFLGWVERNKGIFELLEAINQLRDSGVHLLIGGEGADDETFDTKTCELGLDEQVKRAGWVSGQEKLDLLAEADVFVMPSYREGMPNALLEAMAAGLPCVASSVGGIPDIITDGETGFLVEARDVTDLARALQKLISSPDLRRTMGLCAQNKVIRDHSLEIAVSKFEVLFKQLRDDNAC